MYLKLAIFARVILYLPQVSSRDDPEYNALKESVYRIIINNYPSYHNVEKFTFDKENWLMDGIASYTAANMLNTAKYADAFNSDTSFVWYGYGSDAQYAATHTFFKYLENKYSSKVIDKTLYYLGSGMVSNTRCHTVEDCALLQAVYDMNGLDINKKRHTLDVATLIKEWEVYKNN